MVEKRMDLEEQLRKAIVESPLSLNQLAQACEIDKGILSRFVRGQRTMTLTTAARLAEVLELEFKPAKRRTRKG